MSPFGFRSFNRNWVNLRYSFATKTLIGCEHGRITNDMISYTKRRKMAARILAVRFSLCPHIPAKKTSRPSVVRCKMCSRHTIHLWTQIIMCKQHIILHSARFLSICPSTSWMFLASTRWSFVVRPKLRQTKKSGFLQQSTLIPVHVGSADQSKTTLFEVRLRSI